MSAVVGFATVYDLFINSKSGEMLGFGGHTSQSPLICFSAYSNAKKLFSVKSPNKDLRFINGIKVITMIWIVTANVYLLGYQPQLKSLISINLIIC